MLLKRLKKVYKPVVVSLILLPNLFVMVFGIESFPYTCAPMFGHYIDEETNLYLFKFEGINDNTVTDLTEYYGKPEEFFIRHFFSKVYGSTESISPFTNKLSESPKAFQKRMDEFFNNYSSFLLKEYKLSFERIELKVETTHQDRINHFPAKTIGYFDSHSKSYHSVH
ncbi:hypothetical protein WJN01_09280 [Flavobacteriaceae bacterium SZ-1-7]|uniref:hypothetical protein n=1 Tax=Tamlana sedimenti TaxID=3134126 RepID=UPI003123E798